MTCLRTCFAPCVLALVSFWIGLQPSHAQQTIVPRLGINEDLLPPPDPMDPLPPPEVVHSNPTDPRALSSIPAIAELDPPGVTSDNRRFAVAWWGESATGGNGAIWAATVDSTGNIDGRATELAAEATDEYFSNPAVAADADGNFAVIWSEISGSGSMFAKTLRYQLFNPVPGNGQRLCELMSDPQDLIGLNDFQAIGLGAAPPPPSTVVDSVDLNVDAAASSTGRFIASFSDYRAANWSGTYAALFDLDIVGQGGAPMEGCPSGEGSLVPVNPGNLLIQIAQGAEPNAAPRVDINANTENSVVVWRSQKGEIIAQRIGPTGNFRGGRILVTEQTDTVNIGNHDPDVTINTANDFLVIWERNDAEQDVSSVLYARYGDGGNVTESERPLQTTPDSERSVKRRPKISARDVDRNFSVAWQQSDAAVNWLPGIGISWSVAGPFCQKITGDIGPTTVGIGIQVPSQAIVCTVDPVPSETDARQSYRISPTMTTPNATWLGFEQDRVFEWPDQQLGRLLRIRVSENTSPTLNRCATLEASNGMVFNLSGLFIEQQCTQNNGNCTSCEDQFRALGISSWKPESMADLPLEMPPDDPGDTRASGDYNIQMRWLEQGFEGDQATFVEQFTVNSSLLGRQFAPALGMTRGRNTSEDSEMLVAWFDAAASGGIDLTAQRYTSPVELSINDVGILEGPLLGRATASFTLSANKNYPAITLENGDDECLVPQVTLLTADDSASFISGDYERTTDTLMFAYSDPFGTGNPCDTAPPAALPFAVEVHDDTTYEDTESFVVNLFNEANAIIVKRQGIGAIADNDPPEVVEVHNVTICEDGSIPFDADPMDPNNQLECLGDNPKPFVDILLTLPNPQEVDGSVEFQTLDGIDTQTTDPAIANIDYEPVTGEAQFISGSQSAFLSIDLIDNGARENTKTFRVELTDSTDLSLAGDPEDRILIVSILNDDDCPALPEALTPGGDTMPVELPIGGGIDYLCVFNEYPNCVEDANGNCDPLLMPAEVCDWNTSVDFMGGTNWLAVTDYPRPALDGLDPDNNPDDPDFDAICGGLMGGPNMIPASGLIRYVAQSNEPVSPNDPSNNQSRFIPLVFENGSAEGQNPVFDVTQEGGMCSPVPSITDFSFFPPGGEGSFEVGFFDELGNDISFECRNVSWTVSVSSGAESWIDIGQVDNGSDNTGQGIGTVEFEVLENAPPQPLRLGQIKVAGAPIDIDQEGAFYDHFEDGIRPSPARWSYSDFDAWSEPALGTHLIGDTGDFLSAIAAPAFPGCTVCEVESAIRIDSFGKGTATLYMWYTDDQNYLALTVDEFLDRWTLTQRVAGTDHVRRTLNSNVLVGTQYPVMMAYDDSQDPIIEVTINGIDMCPPQTSGGTICEPWVDPADPNNPVIGYGTVGFSVEGSVVAFDLISVVRSDGAAYPSEISFADGFEGQ